MTEVIEIRKRMHGEYVPKQCLCLEAADLALNAAEVVISGVMDEAEAGEKVSAAIDDCVGCTLDVVSGCGTSRKVCNHPNKDSLARVFEGV